MRARLRCLGVLIVLLLLHGAAAAGERKVALVIGNSAYRDVPALPNPVRDAEMMAAMFRTSGFDTVTLKRDLDSQEMKREIRTFMVEARDADVAVVYFAGHGIEANGVNYLIPTDGKLKTDFDIEDEGVPLERIIRSVELARRLRLIIVDACRDNPFARKMHRTVSVRGINSGLAKVEPAATDTLVAFAAKAGSVAEDGSGDHSPFSAALAKHLPTPGLDLRVAFGRVRDDVLRATGGRQEPFVYGSLGGATISLVPAAAGPGATGGAEDAARAVQRDYEFAERVSTTEAWTSFLQVHKTGFFADLARAQLAKLRAAAGQAGLTRPVEAPPRLKLPTAQTASPPLPPRPGPDAAAGCAREREMIARLRDRPVAADIERLSRTITCAELRPQIARLLESTVSVAKGAAPPVDDRPDASPSTSPAPGPRVRSRVEHAAKGCEEDELALARLREGRDRRAVDRFAGTLTCEDLRPQLQRLRESLADD